MNHAIFVSHKICYLKILDWYVGAEVSWSSAFTSFLSSANPTSAWLRRASNLSSCPERFLLLFVLPESLMWSSSAGTLSFLDENSGDGDGGRLRKWSGRVSLVFSKELPSFGDTMSETKASACSLNEAAEKGGIVADGSNFFLASSSSAACLARTRRSSWRQVSNGDKAYKCICQDL